MPDPDLHQFWQKALSDWRVSGLSGAAYCKQRSLVYRRFIYWNQKLNRNPDDKAGSQSGFARLATVPGDSEADGLTISLPGGVSITGLNAGNIEFLGAVLRQL